MSTTTAAIQAKAAFNPAHMLRLSSPFHWYWRVCSCHLRSLPSEHVLTIPDMWWHLKMGEIIWTNHHVPTVDLFRTQPGTTPGFRMSGYRNGVGIAD